MSLEQDIKDVFGTDTPLKEDGLPEGFKWQERGDCLSKKRVWQLLAKYRAMSKHFAKVDDHGCAALCDVFVSDLQDAGT